MVTVNDMIFTLVNQNSPFKLNQDSKNILGMRETKESYTVELKRNNTVTKSSCGISSNLID